MTVRQSLEHLLDILPDERLEELRDFAEFLAQRNDEQAWRAAARQRFAQAYGDDEPEYSAADVKPELEQ